MTYPTISYARERMSRDEMLAAARAFRAAGKALELRPLPAREEVAANTLSALCNVALLSVALRRKLKFLDWAVLLQPLAALAAAAVLAGAVAWFGLRFWNEHVGHATLLLKFGAVFAPAGAAALVYGVVCVCLGVPSAREIWTLIRQRLGWRP